MDKETALKNWEQKKEEKKLYDSRKKKEKREKKKALGLPLNDPKKAEEARKKQVENKVRVVAYLDPEEREKLKSLIKSEGFTNYSDFIKNILK